MKILISIFFLFLLAGAMTPSNTVQPESDATVGSGREELMEEMNPASNPLPHENESEEFRGSTIQKEEAEPVDQMRTVPEGSPLNEHDGHYRKGL